MKKKKSFNPFADKLADKKVGDKKDKYAKFAKKFKSKKKGK
jgi:hypothetical protein